MAGPRSAAVLVVLGGALFAAGWLVGSWTSARPAAGRGGVAPRVADRPGKSKAAPAAGATPPRSEHGSAPDTPAPASATVQAAASTPASEAAAATADTPPPAAIHRAGLGRAGPPPPYSLPEEMKGRVADALTGAAIPGAQLELHWALSDGTESGGLSIAPGDDGSWTLRPRELMRHVALNYVRREGMPDDPMELRRRFATVEEALAEFDYSLRASAPGYESGEKGDPGAATDLGLRPDPRDRLPGSIRVDARWPDGVGFRGRLLLEYWHDERGWFAQWVLPDAAGEHLVAGVPPGRWNIRVAGREDSGAEVSVPEAGEVRVTLRVHRRGVEEPKGAPAGPLREVEVGTGPHPVAAGAFVRAEARENLFFRSEVEGASARFEALPAGKWEFVLEVPGRPEVRFVAEVPEAPDRLRLEFPAPK